MKRGLRASWRIAALAALLTIGGAGAGASSASAATFTDCAATNPSSPCIKYCYIEPGRTRHPCGIGNQPNLTSGTYSRTVPLSAATQDATGVPGDPGGSGTTSLTMNQSANQICATTSWSGIDSPVVMAHIHGGAYGMPENPGITVSLFDPDMLNGRSSPASGCSLVPPGLIFAIRRCPREFNVVVHSQKHPVGAIRGQLGTMCAPTASA